MNKLALLLIFAHAGMALAETPNDFIARYSAEAGAGFKADGRRGLAFAKRDWGVSGELPRCVACHAENPREPGRHAITGKRIGPLSPTIDTERFSDPAKVEKWFRRNCKEVVGRACTPAEKADFIQFALGAR